MEHLIGGPSTGGKLINRSRTNLIDCSFLTVKFEL